VNTPFKLEKLVRSRTDEELLADVRRAADANDGKLTQKLYRQFRTEVDPTIADDSTVSRQIGWSRALLLAGVKLDKYQQNDRITEDQLLEEILRVWTVLGRQPTTTDLKNRVSKYPRERYSDRFGSWQNALLKFIEWVNAENPELVISPTDSTSQLRRTSRDVNIRLRFNVMKRDNFKCRVCGTSPAKDHSVILHIDHIEPYSKGGETVMDNLQTLCQNCNLGKSDS